MNETGGLHYIHERIDQLINQTALEIGLIRLHTGIDPGSAQSECDRSLELTRRRFWMADDAAGEKHGKPPRER
jgi:hypothetical protein